MAAVLLVAVVALSACSSDESSGTKPFCKDLKKASTELGNGLQNSKSIEVLRTNIRKAETTLATLVDKAPNEIQDDVRTLADGFKRVVSTADESSSLADFGQRADKLAGELKGYSAADKKLNTWQKDNCAA